ncbi:MAG: efflux RND transporter permease subunit [Zoogloeaceae bacterium]|uniref:efflux RND transporter permease subunit n=1 Tax=Denitromonas sp. TaxID=2734609 RepID=UPI001DF72E0B|nr:efflux RND transporter permease subunit [Rhodocyclaceae bacterium]MCP5222288.1 efflux RND transporter permease subunit [Zoogloeaceae bacterium]
MNFSAWSIRNPVPALLLFALLTVLGLGAFRALGIQNFPDIELPTITVSASYEGVAPSQLETEVARKIEDQVATLGGIEHITTTLTDGSAVISVEFELEKDTEVALNEVRNAVDSVRADLPADMRDPVVSKVTTSGSAILTYAVRSDRLDEEALSWFVDNDVSKALLAVKGVGAVSRVGGVDREVQVDLLPERMAALGVTAADVSSRLGQVQVDASGGRGDIGGTIQSVRTLGAVATVADIAALEIPLAGGRRVRIDEVARVRDGIAERSSITLLDGQPAVSFEITRIKGASEVAVADAVREAVASLQAKSPQVVIEEAFNTVEPVEDNFEGSMELLYEGALLAVLVVWWFLRDWRATLVSAAALPLSIIPTFLAMQYLGFSLNTLTLLALALVVGILVDDAIVEIENIVRHLRMGKTPIQAATEAADEIGLAVIATTFTLVAVFLPTAFMGGVPGKFFKQFGITAAVAVVASLVVARLLTPMMAAYFLKAHGAQPADSWLMKRYLGWADWCLKHRKTTTLAALMFFVGSLMLVPLLPTGFVPAADRAQTKVSIEMQPGSPLSDTYAVAEQARRLLSEMPEVTRVFSAIGSGTSGGGAFGSSSTSDVRKATLTVNLVSRHDRDKQSAVEAEIRQRMAVLPGARVSVGAGNTGENLKVVLAGEDAEALRLASAAVTRDLRTLSGIGNVTSGASLQRPEIHVTPDFARAADLGVTASAMASAIRVATAGDYDANLPKLNLPQRQIPIRVRLDESVRHDLDAVRQLRVAANSGEVALETVAGLRMGSGPAQIDRYDRQRNVSIDVELGSLQLGEAVALVDQLPAIKSLPAGISRPASGDAERMTELFGSFGSAMLIGVLCIYVVLVLLFHDFLQPATIIAALPLSVGGAFMALLITNSSFSMPSVIGLLMLMGIVTKNSILLVEYAVMARREHGMARFEALIDACHKRARPILMTTIAMGAGMFPIALGLGAEPSFRAPMAIAVIGGLITSTLLSLLVIPVVFTYVDDLLEWLKRLAGRLHRANHGATEGA